MIYNKDEGKMYSTMKVFDCQNMPDDIRRLFFDHSEANNDTFVSWCMEDPDCIVNKWLLENGATKDDGDVIINHWW